ncbi:MAG: DNA replication/repair protein RecF [Chloroflexota bacterium]
MYLSHLSLENFRNYARLELDLPPGTIVLLGHNAQGKTNLLEAIYYLATSKSFRATSDREIVNWLALEDDQAVARLVGRCQREKGPVEVEIAVRASRADNGADDLPTVNAKRIRVNKTARRAIDLIGQVNVVMFTPQDIELVSGAPLLRRRYIDVTISQVDPQYCRTLAHYNRVVAQRNHLLRRIRDRHARNDQIQFWDEELVKAGTAITVQRRQALEELSELAEVYHRQLTGTGERLHIVYRPSIDLDRCLGNAVDLMADPSAAVSRGFQEQLRRLQAREIAMGMSMLGPHRDDLQFLIDQVNVNSYGSRGQQRTVSLSLKLAESSFLNHHTGEKPILLLDDILSELDEPRRRFVVETIKNGQQVLITSTDLHAFPRSFLDEVALLAVENGAVSDLALSGDEASPR